MIKTDTQPGTTRASRTSSNYTDASSKKPSRRSSNNSGDATTTFDLEPNPFEQSFANGTGNAQISSGIAQTNLYPAAAGQTIKNGNMNGGVVVGHNGSNRGTAIQINTGATSTHDPSKVGNYANRTMKVSDMGVSAADNQAMLANIGVITTPGGRRHILPGVASLSSPNSLLTGQTHMGWDESLRAGPLSPAMLQAPQQQQGGVYSSQMMQNNGHINQQYQQENGTLGAQASSTNGNVMTPNSLAAMASLVSGLRPNNSNVRMSLTPGESSALFQPPGPTTAAILGLGDSNLLSDSSIVEGSGGPVVSVARESQAQTTSTLLQQHKYTTKPIRSDSNAYPEQQGARKHSKSGETQITIRVDTANGISENGEKSSGVVKLEHENGTAENGKIEINSKRGFKKRAKNGASEETALAMETLTSTMGLTKSKKARKSAETSEDEKRKSFLERNRIAALKCRQRKKEWVNDIQSQLKESTKENDDLKMEIRQLKEQLASLRAILIGQKNGTLSVEDAVRAVNEDGSTVTPVLMPLLPVHTSGATNNGVQNTNSTLVAALASANTKKI